MVGDYKRLSLNPRAEGFVETPAAKAKAKAKARAKAKAAAKAAPAGSACVSAAATALAEPAVVAEAL